MNRNVRSSPVSVWMSSCQIVCCALWTSVTIFYLFYQVVRFKKTVNFRLDYQNVKWLDNEQMHSVRNVSRFFLKQKTGFVVKSCFHYTELDCRNDWIKEDRGMWQITSFSLLLTTTMLQNIYGKYVQKKFGAQHV